jgi:chromosome segregation ATPase
MNNDRLNELAQKTGTEFRLSGHGISAVISALTELRDEMEKEQEELEGKNQETLRVSAEHFSDAKAFALKATELEQENKLLKEAALLSPLSQPHKACDLDEDSEGYSCELDQVKAKLAAAEQRSGESDQIVDDLASAVNQNCARIAQLEAELAMATDAANKGDKARCLAGAMEDRIVQLEAQLKVARSFIDASTLPYERISNDEIME